MRIMSQWDLKCAVKSEGCEESMLICLMNKFSATNIEGIRLSQENYLSVDRGYMTPRISHILNERNISFFCTHKSIASFPFSTESSNRKECDTRVEVKDSEVRREFWDWKKVERRDNYALAYGEVESSSVVTVSTNIKYLLAYMGWVKATGALRDLFPVCKEHVCGRSEEDTSISPAKFAVDLAMKKSVALTAGQSTDCLWFIHWMLRVTSKSAHSFLTSTVHCMG